MTLLLGTALSKGLLSLGLNLGSQIPRPLRWLVLLPHNPTSCVLPLKSPFHPTPVYLPRLVICREAPWLLLFNGLVVFNSSVTPMDCGPSGSSLQGILQARIPGWVAMPSSRGQSQPRDRSGISCIGRLILYH